MKKSKQTSRCIATTDAPGKKIATKIVSKKKRRKPATQNVVATSAVKRKKRVRKTNPALLPVVYTKPKESFLEKIMAVLIALPAKELFSLIQKRCSLFNSEHAATPHGKALMNIINTHNKSVKL